jgi:hypothetical protein
MQQAGKLGLTSTDCSEMKRAERALTQAQDVVKKWQEKKKAAGEVLSESLLAVLEETPVGVAVPIKPPVIPKAPPFSPVTSRNRAQSEPPKWSQKQMATELIGATKISERKRVSSFYIIVIASLSMNYTPQLSYVRRCASRRSH